MLTVAESNFPATRSSLPSRLCLLASCTYFSLLAFILITYTFPRASEKKATKDLMSAVLFLFQSRQYVCHVSPAFVCARFTNDWEHWQRWPIFETSRRSFHILEWKAAVQKHTLPILMNYSGRAGIYGLIRNAIQLERWLPRTSVFWLYTRGREV